VTWGAKFVFVEFHPVHDTFRHRKESFQMTFFYSECDYRNPEVRVTTILTAQLTLVASLAAQTAATSTASALAPTPSLFQSSQVRFRAETVITGLKQPSALVFLPEGNAILVERQKGISLVDVSTGSVAPLQGGPEAIIGAASGVHDPNRPAALTGEDAGFHDVVLHPEYAKNGWIYLSYSTGERDRSTTVVDRFKLNGNKIAERQRIFTAEAYSEDRFHYGGRMVFLDGYLFLSVGDRHHQDRAQDLTNDAAKVLRLRDDGSAPPDNPFIGKKTEEGEARATIWSYGNRNIQGMIVHPQTGELWSHEHGPLGGDELNIIRRGANYGWPVISYGWQYSGGPIGQGITKQQGMEQPLWVWTPGIAPSGMIFYTGDKFPAWRGSLFIGAMGQRHLNRLVVQDGRVVLEERLMNRQRGRIRLVAQGPDGFIYVGNDDGELLRLRPAE
jgi:glucose/arabinose dehydrogenase